jgi:hypothetical protein
VSEVSDFLLEECFWKPLDEGIAAEETALIRGRLQDRPLLEFLQARFGLSDHDAQFEIEAARHEVRL